MLEAGTIDGSFGIWSVPLPSSKAPRAPKIVIGTDSVFGGAFDPTSNYVAITGGLSVSTRKIGIWTVATGAPRAAVPTTFYNQRPTAAVFSAQWEDPGRGRAQLRQDPGLRRLRSAQAALD